MTPPTVTLPPLAPLKTRAALLITLPDPSEPDDVAPSPTCKVPAEIVVPPV